VTKRYIYVIDQKQSEDTLTILQYCKLFYSRGVSTALWRWLLTYWWRCVKQTTLWRTRCVFSWVLPF